MKVMDKTKIITSNFCDKIMTERRVLEDVAGIPFLMQLHYAFQTDRNVYLILGEYIRNYMHGRKSTITPCAMSSFGCKYCLRKRCATPHCVQIPNSSPTGQIIVTSC
jgi:hypothetical protein